MADCDCPEYGDQGSFKNSSVMFRDVYSDTSAAVPMSGKDTYLVMLQTEADRLAAGSREQVEGLTVLPPVPE
jgi:hypothetical protein